MHRNAAVLAASLALLPSAAEARTIRVDCAAGQSIQHRLSSAHPGDTLLVRGTCTEHVTLSELKSDVTLDGQGSAEIHAPGITQAAIRVRARGAVIRGFRIVGGEQGIAVLGGGAAVIDGNVIEGAANSGILVTRHSSAGIVNNTVQSNGSDGITVTESSSARIGFLDPDAGAPSPNLLTTNARGGVTVSRSSNARIAGNTITGNGDAGVRVVRAAHADIAGNVINGNAGGILVSQNSGVNLADVPDAPFLEQTNSGTNTGFGVSCAIGAYLAGSRGPLTGTAVAVQVASGCVNLLGP
jgi:parallel beta-helix repeat protein